MKGLIESGALAEIHYEAFFISTELSVVLLRSEIVEYMRASSFSYQERGAVLDVLDTQGTVLQVRSTPDAAALVLLRVDVFGGFCRVFAVALSTRYLPVPLVLSPCSFPFVCSCL